MPSKRSDKPRSNFMVPTLPKDWSEFLSLLMSHGVRFVVVGGHAVAVHGHPRFTEDLDVFVEPNMTNASSLREVLSEFGFGNSAPSTELLAEPERVFMIGVKPLRIDILTAISGVSFDEAWKGRLLVSTKAGRVPFIGLTALLKNKKASARTKDRGDIEELVELMKIKPVSAKPRGRGNTGKARKRPSHRKG
jgi:hypothetical protein